VGQVPSPERLVALAKRFLEANRTRRARVTTAQPRSGRRLWVYGRPGRPCLRCGTPVRAAEQGGAGRERGTFWCPGCQQGPTPAA
jgi:endonuclease VIII